MAIQTPNGFNLDNSGKRIVVDPVTRIEGHMRVEVNVDSNNVIRNAVSTGTMWRGIEVILKGRDPRDAWAFTERICGVCTGTHALTSVRAVENALDIKIPENANSIRNIMQLCLQVHDHLVHFYHHESCGQCTPCREGLGWMQKILKDLIAGKGRAEDIDLLLELCDNIEMKTVCVLSAACTMSLRSYLNKFRSEFEVYAAKNASAQPVM